MSEEVQPRYLTYHQAERYTGLSNHTLRRAVRRGDLLASGWGTSTRFDRYELDRWMRDRK